MVARESGGRTNDRSSNYGITLGPINKYKFTSYMILGYGINR
ncbi:hypothetical protein HG66A1_52690 [Gimesia chilikensis]|jgi:hypothetical protein|uniref:Uncharacterized protein n=1 Tax=Gimesia chilikensis TaxID=2605989 RepID=A0A517PVP4_9PLAN|nr:hypothetical protein HG66A1_52690 [Gimesia chilikensis]